MAENKIYFQGLHLPGWGKCLLLDRSRSLLEYPGSSPACPNAGILLQNGIPQFSQVVAFCCLSFRVLMMFRASCKCKNTFCEYNPRRDQVRLPESADLSFLLLFVGLRQKALPAIVRDCESPRLPTDSGHTAGTLSLHTLAGSRHTTASEPSI